MQTTTPQVHDDSDSSSEDEFLRLASASARRKAGLPVKTHSPRQEHESKTEKRTRALKQAARKAEFTISGRNAINRRLQATIDALDAKTKSLTVGVAVSGKTIFEQKEASDDIPESAVAILSAPSDIQEMYKIGYSYMVEHAWKEASIEWENIVALPMPPSLDWFLPLLAQLAFAYKKLGYLRQALKCYHRIRSSILHANAIRGEDQNSNKEHHDFLADTLHQMSAIYHELGDIEHAMQCVEEANSILLDLVGKSCDTAEEKARLDQLHESRQLSRLLQEAASGDFSGVEMALAENTASIDTIASFVDSATSATFLMAAAGSGNMSLITELQALPSWKSLLELQDSCGNTALAWACKFGQVQVIEFLLEHGAAFLSLKKEELKTWPKESLTTIQTHLASKKKQKKISVVQVDLPPPPTPPVPTSKPLYQPLVPVSPQKNAKIPKQPAVNTNQPAAVNPKQPAVNANQLAINASFNAAPPSAAAATGALVGRELQQWQPDQGDTITTEGLEGDNCSEWDQFETNKRLFGVQSGFDENIYTTPLNKGTEEQNQQAERLANEILSQRSSNKHVMEERGIDEANYDPEARYSAVLGSGAYATSPKTQSQDSFIDDLLFQSTALCTLTWIRDDSIPRLTCCLMEAKLIGNMLQNLDQSKLPWGGYTKTIALCEGHFEVYQEIPEMYKLGIFATPMTYSVYIRLSNASSVIQPDSIKDVRGVAIKLLHVPGEKLSEAIDTSSQDFLFTNYPTLPLGTIKLLRDNMRLPKALLTLKMFFTGQWGRLAAMKKSRISPSSLLNRPYYSGTPYTVKYVLLPVSTAPVPIVLPLLDDCLSSQTQAQLHCEEVAFEFGIQVHHGKMPIDDASGLWPEKDAPIIRLARLTLPRQTFRTPERAALATRLKFDPFNALPVHRPVGETLLPNEAELIQEIITDIEAAMKQRAKGGEMKRGAHAKHIALCNATFEVLPDLPEDFRVGLFATPHTYDAWIRLSNAASTVEPDSTPDIRGFAIKLLNVPGEKVEASDDDTVQDFACISCPTMPVFNAKWFHDLVHHNIAWFLFKFALAGHLDQVRLIKQYKILPTSMFDIPFFSTTPYAFGSSMVVKYVIKPTSATTSTLPDTLTADYLAQQTQKHLNTSEATFEFGVVVQKDTPEHPMPIEDASVLWSEDISPFVPLARITIPKQECLTPERNALAESLRFNPVHALKEHLPLGSLNRARMEVYKVVSKDKG
ncbi:hypothetical protein THRCLA_07801 [Thraustotheca clavata]|uniref:LsmAD domain-containing protein n=1 Tax=Thraustotheca clavata TaxID=74557 RepID=A0A1V9ZC68_9STRA|nr:hypothetical protein THRCLA_07801 [Thraustotheca clavata]